MYKSIALFIAMLLFACNAPSKKKQSITKDTAKSTSVKTSIKNSAIIPNDTVPKILVPKGTIPFITNAVVDSTQKIYLVQACNAHADDVNPAIVKLRWKGLFVSNGKFYIKNARISFSREHDDERDTVGQNTGWHIKSYDKDYGYFISGAHLIDGTVNAVNLSKKTLFPGDAEEFKYNGVTYTLFATGYKKVGIITNYKLFLMANVKGQNVLQQIASTEYFGYGDKTETDEQIEIQFAGDIDGDKIPDFIVNRDGQYSGFTDLYLSASTHNKAILELVASLEFDTILG